MLEVLLIFLSRSSSGQRSPKPISIITGWSGVMEQGLLVSPSWVEVHHRGAAGEELQHRGAAGEEVNHQGAAGDEVCDRCVGGGRIQD